MLTRLAYNAAKIGGTLKSAGGLGKKVMGEGAKKVGGAAGKGVVGGFKGVAKVGKGITGAIRKGIESDIGTKTLTATGKFAGSMANNLENDIRGINNILGTATGGFSAKPLTNAMGDMADSLNSKFKLKLDSNAIRDHRFMKLIKDSDDSLLLGKRATALGGTILVAGSGVMATKDAVSSKLHELPGPNTGFSSNAPTNNYAYQGASYADNAGATGDLALALHRQRHSGIL